MEPLPTTGAGLVAYWQREGVIGTRPDIMDSQAHARQLRHKVDERHDKLFPVVPHDNSGRASFL